MEFRLVAFCILINLVVHATSNECVAIAHCKCQETFSGVRILNNGTPPSNGSDNILPPCPKHSNVLASPDLIRQLSFLCDSVVLSNSIDTITPVKDMFTFILKYPCPGYSTGSILIFILLGLISAYLVLGMAFNYFFMGARGIEVIPHLSFWRDLPSLVKDGYQYLRHGMVIQPSNGPSRTPDSYDAI